MIGGGIRTGFGANTGTGVVDRDMGAVEARDAGLEPALAAATVGVGVESLLVSSLVSSGSSAITVWASSDPTKGEDS